MATICLLSFRRFPEASPVSQTTSVRLHSPGCGGAFEMVSTPSGFGVLRRGRARRRDHATASPTERSMCGTLRTDAARERAPPVDRSCTPGGARSDLLSRLGVDSRKLCCAPRLEVSDTMVGSEPGSAQSALARSTMLTARRSPPMSGTCAEETRLGQRSCPKEGRRGR
eukprot:4852663-Prymnesium_polylepis.2